MSYHVCQLIHQTHTARALQATEHASASFCDSFSDSHSHSHSPSKSNSHGSGSLSASGSGSGSRSWLSWSLPLPVEFHHPLLDMTHPIRLDMCDTMTMTITGNVAGTANTATHILQHAPMQTHVPHVVGLGPGHPHPHPHPHPGHGAATATPPSISSTQQQQSPWVSSVQDIVAGTVGGMSTVLVGHPLDTLKVRLQASSASSGAYSGFVDVTRQTWQHEGVRGFYKGMQSPLAGEAFFNAVQFLAYGHSKTWLQQFMDKPKQDGTLDVHLYFAAGALTGFASCFVEGPIDLFKSQLQTQIFHKHPLFTTFPQCVQYIWKHNGFRGIYQGLGSTFLRTVPASAAYFGSYEWMRTLLLAPGQQRDDLPASRILLAGGVGGFMYWFSTFPFDSIKSAMQSDAIIPSQRAYHSIMDCARKMYAEGGIQRFYRGLTPCLIRSFPANAACFFAYERALQLMKHQ